MDYTKDIQKAIITLGNASREGLIKKDKLEELKRILKSERLKYI